jgi:tRNA nucleotidyltransferase (CCA-adding enzyme)
LQRRDFTVNAIAYQPHQRRFTDPLGGRADVQQRALRAICADNLRDDPLRLLRAYRQCAQLGLVLTPGTRRMVRQLAPELGRVAAERVQKELDLLLATQQGADWLEAARCDGVLRGWLPRLQRYHSDQLAVLSAAIATLEPHWSTIQTELDAPIHGMGKGGALPLETSPLPASQPLSDRGTWRAIARLALVLGPDPDSAVQDLQRLKYSRLEVRAVGLVVRTLVPSGTGSANEWPRSRREQYRCFQAVGASFPALVATAIARGDALDPWLDMIRRWQTPHDPLVHPQALVSGRDLMTHLNIAPGPHIGQLLTDLELARIDGSIHTPAEAIALAQQWLDAGQVAR